jgi:hypothetical protein
MASRKRIEYDDKKEDEKSNEKRANSATEPNGLSPKEISLILNDPRVQQVFDWFTGLPREQQIVVAKQLEQLDPRNLPFMGLKIPHDVHEYLMNYVTTGTLMRLARANHLFNEIASNDIVWERMVARDYPNDFAFCRGNLPFFVLTVDHPFYVPGCIYEFERMPWKRFYLRLEDLYRKAADQFYSRHKYDSVYLRASYEPVTSKPVQKEVIPFIDTKKAGAREIYRWYIKYGIEATIETSHEPIDRLAGFVWLFICAFVALTQNDRFIFREVCVDRFWTYAQERNWMWKYLRSMAGAIWTGVPSGQLIYIQGPHFSWWTAEHELISGHSALFDEVKQMHIERNMLFSADDRKSLISLLEAARESNILFPSFTELSMEERSVRIEGFLKFWDLLAACTAMPCLLSNSLLAGTGYSGVHLQTAYLALYGQEVKAKMSSLIGTLDPTILLNPFPNWRKFPENDQRWFLSLLDDTISQRQVDTILYPWSPEDWGEIIRFYGERVSLNTSGTRESVSLSLKVLLSLFATAPRIGDGRLSYIDHPLCIQCGLVPEQPMQCGGICQDTHSVVVYCNTDCQRAHWHEGGHAKVCGKK